MKNSPSHAKHLFAIAALALWAAAISSIHAAPVGTVINYQGQLTDGGSPANGNYDLTFALYDDLAAGAQVGSTVTNLNVAVTGGVFTTLLDFGAGIFDGTAYGLAIGVRSNGVEAAFTPVSPRQPVNPTPYALYATTSPLADNAVTSAKIVDGAVGTADLGNNAVTSAKILDGTIVTADLANNSVTSAKVLDGTLIGADLAEGTVGTRELANTIALGRSNVIGRLDVFFANTAANQPAVVLNGNDNSIRTYGSDGLEQTRLWGASWGELQLFDSTVANNLAVNLTANGSSGGLLNLYEGGTNRIGAQMTAGTTSGGTFRLYRGGTTQNGVQFLGGSTFGGTGSFYNGTNRETIRLDGAVNTTVGSRISLNQANGTLAVRLSAEEYAGDGGLISIRNAAGVEKIELDGDDGDGGAVVRLKNAAGATTITLDAEFGGDGRIITQELQITGGSDLSEQFDITAPDSDVQPGMVVCIDPQSPGQLVLSTRAHDRTVAGIISGAGGVKPGMLMGQKGTAADGKHPVALTGRVYCWVDASHGAIEPGDLLTTSNTPGHAMKVKHPAQAQGAILGKAMTRLTEEKGLVLVLVSLQ